MVKSARKANPYQEKQYPYRRGKEKYIKVNL